MMYKIAIILSAAALTWQCAGTLPDTGPFMQGTYQKKIDVTLMGSKRSYNLHIPGKVREGEPLPLVLVIHGAFSNAKTIEKESGFSALADREGFLVAYPEGGFGLFGLFQHWNAGHCCGKAQSDNVDDVGFLEAVISDIKQVLPVDSTRIYMVGFSNGGMLTYRFAAEKTDMLAAAAPMAASAGGRANQHDSLWIITKPKSELPLIVFHGMEDQHVPFSGGSSPKKGGERTYLSVMQSIGIWIENNACNSKADSDTLYDGQVYRSVWGAGQSGTIELYAIKNWGHRWPGPYFTRELKSNNPLRNFDSAEIIWNFFTNISKSDRQTGRTH